MGEQAVNSITGIAGSAITVNRFCKVASDGEWDHVGTAQANADGVSLDAASAAEATANKAIPFAKPDGGLVWVEAGAAIAAIATRIASDSVGRAIAFVAGTVNNRCLGINLTTAGAAGEKVLVQFSHYETDGGT